MANVNVTSNAWTEISITSGTIQNISATADIELSAEQTDNSGVVLKPSELYQWDNETIYARAVTEETGALRVVNFKRATGGGGYVLPVASASTLGGVKVGANLSIDENGVLSAAGSGGVSYSTTEQQIGTWVDGKPLYQKSLVLENITVQPMSASLANSVINSTFINSLTDLLKIVNCQFMCRIIGTDEHIGKWGFESNEDLEVQFDETITLRHRWGSIPQTADVFITVQYTKTTD